MFSAKRIWGAVTSVMLAAAGLVATAAPAQAYATAPTLGSGASSTTIATNALSAISTGNASQKYSWDNMHGGVIEVGAPNANTKSITLRSYVNGALDTSFGGTGEVTFSGQLFNYDATQHFRVGFDFTTYANGTKWMVQERNTYMSTGLNYIHLGTYAGGYVSTLTLPTGNSDYAFCQSATGTGTYTTMQYNVELVQNSPFANPYYLLNCGVYLNTAGSSGLSYISYVANLSGGTVVGTAGTHSILTRVSPVPNSTSPNFVRVGYSTNPAASGATFGFAAFYQMSSSTSSVTAPSIYSTATWNGYEIWAAPASASGVTQTTSAWTPSSNSSRTGTLVVAPRHSGTIRALTVASDGTTCACLIKSFAANGGTPTSVAATGVSVNATPQIVVDTTPSASLIKITSNDTSTVTNYEANLSTNVIATAGSFTSGSMTYDTMRWQPAATSSGVDFYARTSATVVTRVSASSAPTAPATPAAPTATRGASDASLTWTAPGNGGAAITSYSIRYSSNSGSTWTTTQGANPSWTSATVTGLTNGTSYIFQVAATNSAGTSAWSPSSSAVVPATVPDAPTNLSVSGGDSSITASWTAPVNDGGDSIFQYVLEYSVSGSSSWSTFVPANSTATTATITGLVNGTSYIVRVAAENSIWYGAFTANSAAVLVVAAPGAPSAVTAVRGDSQVVVSWTAPSSGGSPITGYTVQYSSNSGSTWTTSSSSVATTSHTVTSLTNGTSYVFRVLASNTIGSSTYSATTSAVSPAATPSQPSITSTSGSSTSATVTWAAPSNSGGFAITDYLIEYSSNSGSTWTTWSHSASTALSATITGLTLGSTYLFRVSAITSVGAGAASANSAGLLIAIAPGQQNAPTVTNGNTQVTVTWVAPLANGCAISSYLVEYSSNGGSSWSVGIASTSSLSGIVTGLQNGVAYLFRTAATNCMGPGATSVASASVTPNTPPATVPTVTVVGSGSTAVTLSWNSPTSASPITDYVIEYSTDGGATWSTFNDGVSTSTSVNLTGLTLGASYTFRITAVSAAGASTSSSATSSVTAATVPGSQASAPIVSSSPGAITVTWQAPSSTGGSAITGLELQFSTDGGTTWQNYIGAIDLSGNIIVTGLTAGQAFVFRSRTTNFFGPSAWSSSSSSVTAQAATAPAAISSVISTPGSNSGSVALSWTAPAANGSAITDYLIEYSIDGGATWQTYAHPASANTSITLTGLVPGATYAFRVTAINAVGSSQVSASSPAVVATVQSTTTSLSQLPTNVKVDRAGQIVANGAVTFQGKNLQDITLVLMNGWEALISSRTADSLTAKVPTQVIGWVSVEFVSKNGRIRYDHVLYVNEAKALTIATLGIGFVANKVTLGSATVHAVSTNQVLIRSVNRITSNISKFASAKSITCLAYVGKGMRAKDALARAKATCSLLAISAPHASVKLAVTKSRIRAHVLALFQY